MGEVGTVALYREFLDSHRRCMSVCRPHGTGQAERLLWRWSRNRSSNTTAGSFSNRRADRPPSSSPAPGPSPEPVWPAASVGRTAARVVAAARRDVRAAVLAEPRDQVRGRFHREKVYCMLPWSSFRRASQAGLWISGHRSGPSSGLSPRQVRQQTNTRPSFCSRQSPSHPIMTFFGALIDRIDGLPAHLGPFPGETQA